MPPLPSSPRLKRRLVPGQMPDPAQAHGAWVYLFSSIMAGCLAAAGEGFLPALLTGLGFAGVFLSASALSLNRRPRILKRLLIGLSLSLIAPLSALGIGADPAFLAFGLVAILPAALSGYFAEKQGFHSPGALGFAVTALAIAAPSSACAGGASVRLSWMLLLLLAPFFTWRTWRLMRVIRERRDWTRPKLRRAGLLEALYAVAWTGFAVGLLHL